MVSELETFNRVNAYKAAQIRMGQGHVPIPCMEPWHVAGDCTAGAAWVAGQMALVGAAQ